MTFEAVIDLYFQIVFILIGIEVFVCVCLPLVHAYFWINGKKAPITIEIGAEEATCGLVAIIFCPLTLSIASIYCLMYFLRFIIRKRKEKET